MRKYMYTRRSFVNEYDLISDYKLELQDRLNPRYNTETVIRIHITPNMEFFKHKCENYYIALGNRTIGELLYDIMVWNKFKQHWEIWNEFKGCNLDNIKRQIRQRQLNTFHM